MDGIEQIRAAIERWKAQLLADLSEETKVGGQRVYCRKGHKLRPFDHPHRLTCLQCRKDTYRRRSSQRRP